MQAFNSFKKNGLHHNGVPKKFVVKIEKRLLSGYSALFSKYKSAQLVHQNRDSTRTARNAQIYGDSFVYDGVDGWCKFCGCGNAVYGYECLDNCFTRTLKSN